MSLNTETATLSSKTWDAVNEHYQRTGKVPAGLRLIKTETREGDNVTKLEIIDGSD